MDGLSISPEMGMWGVFLSSFLAATVLPGGSEVVLFGVLKLHPDQLWPILLLGTLGNTLGGMTSWACGRWLPRWQRLDALTQSDRVRRWGAPILLLAWVPLIGDALCVAAGWLRFPASTCAVFMALGKFGRYWLVAQGALG